MSHRGAGDIGRKGNNEQWILLAGLLTAILFLVTVYNPVPMQTYSDIGGYIQGAIQFLITPFGPLYSLFASFLPSEIAYFLSLPILWLVIILFLIIKGSSSRASNIAWFMRWGR
ncbi:MAG: hypothetical protein DRN78_02820 [Thermoproteota archaeon]|nr:MAG: hypothetical protein DRN78_02820 [Candidatus Korarchaeota archaeon]